MNNMSAGHGLRKLIDIDVDELSLVDKAANRRTFAIIKADDELMSALRELKLEPSGLEKDLPEDARAAVKDALATLSRFDDVFPPDLAEAIKVLARHAGAEDGDYGYTEKAEASEDTRKAVLGALNVLNKFTDDYPPEVLSAIKVLAKFAAVEGYGEKKKKPKPKPEDEEAEEKLAEFQKLAGVTPFDQMLFGIRFQASPWPEKRRMLRQREQRITKVAVEKGLIVPDEEGNDNHDNDRPRERARSRSLRGQDDFDGGTDEGEDLWPSFSFPFVTGPLSRR